jgi:hypothetical protein
MTDLQTAYTELRAEDRLHFAACRLLAHRFELDERTVVEKLRKADALDRREAKRAA